MIAVMSPAPSGARFRFGLFLLAGLVLFVFPALLSLAVDWHWFSEVGYLPLLTLSITARALVGAVVFAIAAGWLILNLRAGWEALAEEPVSFTTREGFTVALPSRAQLRPLALLGGLLGAFLLASYASNEWLTLLAWWRHVPFGNPDPVLGHDPAFYIFTLPVLELVRNLGFALVALGAIGSAALYALAGHLAMTPFGPRIGQRVWPHLSWLVAALFVVLALSAWIARAQFLVLPSGIIQGAGYADVQARMPAAMALAGASLAPRPSPGGHAGWSRARCSTVPCSSADRSTAACCSDSWCRRTNRRARRRTSSTTSPPRGARSRSMPSRNESSPATPS
jgi:uncharacterized membrane protein (UPF0182 family)